MPTYNEPLEIVRPTVLAAMEMDWPHDKFKVYLLDDGRLEEFRRFAEEAGAVYLSRPNNVGAKAGNLNNGLAHSDEEFVAVFDCDHVPTRSFLQLTMGGFQADDKLAVVQTPHHFYTPDPFERNLRIFRKVPNEGSLFYGVLLQGNDHWNAAFFCGSCAVMRRRALQDVGGFASETVTEDAHTSLRLQRHGWGTAYLNLRQADGLATGSLAEHVQQRIRWARGMVQILRVENPLFASGLEWPQRLCYFNSTFHFLYAVPRLVFLTAPLVYLLGGISNIYGYVITILAYALPHLILATLVNARVNGRFRYSFWSEVYETVFSPFILLPTCFALISPKYGQFNVTPKKSRKDAAYFDWNIGGPLVILLGLHLAAIAAAVNGLDTWAVVTGEIPPGLSLDNGILSGLPLFAGSLPLTFEVKDKLGTTASRAVELQISSSAPTADGTLAVQYRTNLTNSTANQISPQFRIKNTSTDAVPLSELSLRYYFTLEGNRPLNWWCDWAAAGCKNITYRFVEGSDGDYYMEIGFLEGSGSIAAGGDSGEIQVRVAKDDWSDLRQSDDYSFDAAKTSFTEWEKVPLFRSGILVWGTAFRP